MADHQKLLLGAAAASLAALGIVFVASSVDLPHAAVTIEPTKVERAEKIEPLPAPSIPSPPPPPEPKPTPVRPHPAPSR